MRVHIFDSLSGPHAVSVARQFCHREGSVKPKRSFQRLCGKGLTVRAVTGPAEMASNAPVVPEWYSGDTLYKDIAIESTLGPAGSRKEFTNAKGLKLASYIFPAQGHPKGLVILVHGHGCTLLHEYLYHKEPGRPGVYSGSIIEKLNKFGVAAAGIDLQGCGHSEGLRCYVDRYQDYVDEVLAFAESLDGGPEGLGDLPKFLIGTSLGGCISADLCRQTDLFKGAVLIAPMLSLERVSKSGLNPYIRPLSGFLSWLVPSAKIVKTEKNILFPEIQAFFDKDPQTWKESTRVRNANEYLNATEQLCESMGSFNFPFICFHGEVDTMTDPEGSKKLFAESKAEDKELNIMPGRWHVLLKEQGSEDLNGKISEWIQKRL